LKNNLVSELDKAAPAYANARSTAKGFFDMQDAAAAGEKAAKSGRSEDTISLFRSLSPQQQATFRTGYVDPLIEQVQGGAVGVNKARPFTSDAYQSELQAIAPMRSGNQMMQRLGRENTMFETRNHAFGGSRTADNLADAQSLGGGPEILAKLLSGNIIGAGKNLVGRSLGALSGNTPAVRESLAQALLTTGKAPNLQAYLDNAVNSTKARQQLVAALLRGLSGGGAVGVPAIARNNGRQ